MIYNPNNFRLPKDMIPNQRAFEEIGFNFQEDPNDYILCNATLPQGWFLEEGEVYWSFLFDEKGRKRGKVFFNNTPRKRNGHMRLIRRYSIGLVYTVPDDWYSPIKIVVKDFDDTVIFCAGQCQDINSEELDILKECAENFLREKYPLWENVNCYWD